MNIISYDDALGWLILHGYEFEPRKDIPFPGTEFCFTTELIVHLPAFEHVLIFEPRQILGSRLDVYECLVKWIKPERLFVFRTWGGDDGCSDEPYSGALPEDYLKQIFPNDVVCDNAMGFIWNDDEPETVKRMAKIFDDCLQRNWEAYALSGNRQSIVDLADEIIEARTMDVADYNQVRSRVQIEE